MNDQTTEAQKFLNALRERRAMEARKEAARGLEIAEHVIMYQTGEAPFERVHDAINWGRQCQRMAEMKASA